MASLKDYRNQELKWFLLANILLMLITSKAFTFQWGDASALVEGIGATLNIAVFSTTIYVYTFIFDSLIPSSLKVFLVFLWKKKPSATIFTRVSKKCKDDRFTAEHAKKKYADIFQNIEANKGCDETPMWYEIYNRHRNNSIVFGSNRDYLLLRDLHSQTLTLLIIYAILVRMTGIISFAREYVFYLVAMIIILNIGARVQGDRMVYTVLSVDLNLTATEKNKDDENDQTNL